MKTRAVGVFMWCVRVPRCLFLGFEAEAVADGFVSFLVEAAGESVELRV